MKTPKFSKENFPHLTHAQRHALANAEFAREKAADLEGLRAEYRLNQRVKVLVAERRAQKLAEQEEAAQRRYAECAQRIKSEQAITLQLRQIREQRILPAIAGYAMLFNQFAWDGRQGHYIAYRSGAFAAALASGASVDARVSHDPAQAFATTADRSMLLMEDSRGLFALMQPAADCVGRAAAMDAVYEEFPGLSIGVEYFDEDTSHSTFEGKPLVVVHAARLRDVSLARNPAFPETTALVCRHGITLAEARSRVLLTMMQRDHERACA